MTRKQKLLIEGTKILLREQLNNPDTENAHSTADSLLCLLLIGLGCKDVTDIYADIDKWYA
jgi:hypothetical protein